MKSISSKVKWSLIVPGMMALGMSGLFPGQAFAAPEPPLVPGVPYEVLSSPRPGVFYSQVNATCPYGGQPAGAHCQILHLPNLMAGVSYWVDTDPRWQGVFYAQVGGACPYGGTRAGRNCQIHRF